MDSSITVQALKDSQAFYSNSFIALLTVASVVAALFGFMATKIWEKKVNLELGKLRREFDAMATDAAQKAAREATKESSKKFEDSISKQRQELDGMKADSISLWHENLMDVFIDASKEKNPLNVLERLNTLILKMSNRFDNNFLNMLCEEVLPLYESNVKSLQKAKGFDKLTRALSDSLKLLKNTVTLRTSNRKEKEEALRDIDRILALLNELTNDFIKKQSECDSINKEIKSL